VNIDKAVVYKSGVKFGYQIHTNDANPATSFIALKEQKISTDQMQTTYISRQAPNLLNSVLFCCENTNDSIFSELQRQARNVRNKCRQMWIHKISAHGAKRVEQFEAHLVRTRRCLLGKRNREYPSHSWPHEPKFQ
jgi:hypothetical protein